MTTPSKAPKRGCGFKGKFLIVISGESDFMTIDSGDCQHVGMVEVQVTRNFDDGRGTWQKLRYTSIDAALETLSKRFHKGRRK